MSFTSFEFLGYFTLFITIYFFSNKTVRKGLLFVANILFCLTFVNDGLLYLLGLISYSYLMTKEIIKKKSKSKFIITISVSLLGLLISKYLLFGLRLIHIQASFNLIVPIGISFTTFKVISFIVDNAQGKIEKFPSFFDYMNYVMFFPQLPSGPIERFSEFKKDLDQLDRTLSYDECKTGFLLFGFGAFEKVVIASRLSVIVNSIYVNLNESSSLMVLIAMIAYSFQLYCDFDAYSNMAMGLGKMMGFQGVKNFNTPYLAKNIQDFWRRWHISLSSWFKDYVYIPLGGNRNHKRYRNIFIVSILSGLWHGAAFNFFIWGLLHGVAQFVSGEFNHYITKRLNIRNTYLKICGRLLGILFTFATVSCLWVFFRLNDPLQIQLVFKKLFDFNFVFDLSLLGIDQGQFTITVLLVVMMIGIDCLRYFTNAIDSFKKCPLLVRWVVYCLLILGFILFAMYGGGYNLEDFIYITF